MRANWCLLLGLTAIAVAAPVEIELVEGAETLAGMGELFNAVANYDFDKRPADASRAPAKAIEDESIFGDKKNALLTKKPHYQKGPRDNAVEQANAIVAIEQTAQDKSQANEAAKKPPKSHAGSRGRKKEYDEDEISVQPEEEEEEEPSTRHDSHNHYGGGRHGSSDDAEYYNDAVEHVLKHACSNRGVKEGCSVGTLKGKCVEKSTSGVKLCGA